MLYYAVYYTILYYTVLYYAVLHYTSLYYTTLYCIVSYYTQVGPGVRPTWPGIWGAGAPQDAEVYEE